MSRPAARAGGRTRKLRGAVTRIWFQSSGAVGHLRLAAWLAGRERKSSWGGPVLRAKTSHPPPGSGREMVKSEPLPG